MGGAGERKQLPSVNVAIMLYLSIPLPDIFPLCHPKRGWFAPNPSLKVLKGASQYYYLLSYDLAPSCRVDFTTNPFPIQSLAFQNT